MDDVLEAAEAVEGTELEGIVVWLFRIVGALAVLGGLGLWLLTEMGLLWLPAALMAVGLVLVVAPQVLLALVELL